MAKSKIVVPVEEIFRVHLGYWVPSGVLDRLEDRFRAVSDGGAKVSFTDAGPAWGAYIQIEDTSRANVERLYRIYHRIISRFKHAKIEEPT